MSWSIADRSQGITSLFRQILRATSYLPDQYARIYVRDQVIKRFRQNSSKNGKTDHTTNRLKKARQSLRVLRRAGSGSADDLKAVLMRVYGRNGPRKRVLLEDLLRKDEANLPKDSSALEELIKNPKAHQVTDGEPGSKFFQFLKSQQANQPLEFHSTPIRKLQPTIPAVNIWLRPTPVKAAKGIRRRWWAITLDKILPPVPLAEWNRLEGLANGSLPLDEAPIRRRKATSYDFSKASRAETEISQATSSCYTARDPNKSSEAKWSNASKDVLAFLDHRAKLTIESNATNDNCKHIQMDSVVDTKFVKFVPNMGLCVHKMAIEVPGKPYPHISSHGLRRLYASIWNATPTMQQDEATKTWIIKWGGQRTAAHNGEVTTPSKAQMELFEGLEGVHVPASKRTRGGYSSKDRKSAKTDKINIALGAGNSLLH
jgi:hypothetical protein